MTKEQKLLNEIITSLINTSNVVESVRGKLSRIDPQNFLKAQEYLVASIQHLKRGQHNIDIDEKNRGA